MIASLLFMGRQSLQKSNWTFARALAHLLNSYWLVASNKRVVVKVIVDAVEAQRTFMTTV